MSFARKHNASLKTCKDCFDMAVEIDKDLGGVCSFSVEKCRMTHETAPFIVLGIWTFSALVLPVVALILEWRKKHPPKPRKIAAARVRP